MENTNASVSLELDKRRIKQGNTYPVKILVYFEGHKERYSTGHDLTKEEWNKIWRNNVRDTGLKTIQRKLFSKKEKAEQVIGSMDVFSFELFEEQYFQEKKLRKSAYLKDVFQEYITDLENEGRVGTASIYNTTINSLEEYKSNLRVGDITKKFLQEYEQYMLKKGYSSSIAKKYAKNEQPDAIKATSKKMSPTTVGIYMRHLRAIINKAISDKLLPADKYPFKGYAIPSSRNVKKSLIAPQIRQLLNYRTDDTEKRMRLDYWLFSYISNGINFTDICYLKPENVGVSFFAFHRAKTKNTRKRDKRPIKVPLTAETTAIINRWKNTDASNPYLFPILQHGLTPKQQKYKIQDFIWRVNKAMKAIAEELGIDVKVGTYVARHSHSTMLKRSGASTEMIKENLGHASVLTTENYLDDFEDEVKIEYAKKLTDL